jgi:cytochrome c551/c552
MTVHVVARCAAAVFLTAAAAAGASGPGGDSMTDILRRTGCDLCHEAEPRTYAAGSKRFLAPSWLHIAQRYGDDPDAEERLTNTVFAGTGPLLTDQHWRGKIFFSEMPPNSVQLSPRDARAIVRWILTQPR